MKNKKTLSQTLFSNRENGENVGWYLIVTIDREGRFKDCGAVFRFRDINDDKNYRESYHGKKIRREYNHKYFISLRGRKKIDDYQKSEKGIKKLQEYLKKPEVIMANKIANKKYIKTDKGKEMKSRADNNYRQTEKGKEAHKKGSSIRRQLGFIVLNKPIDGIKCDAHHINEEQIIYIPTVIHNAIFHNLKTNKNMKLINSIAEGFK